MATELTAPVDQFLSTPSGWRATIFSLAPRRGSHLFLSTPSGWRATLAGTDVGGLLSGISIHALRVEGD